MFSVKNNDIHTNSSLNRFSFLNLYLIYLVTMSTESTEDDMTSFIGKWEQLERTNVEELTKVFGMSVSISPV